MRYIITFRYEQAPRLTSIITQTIHQKGIQGLYSGANALIAGNALKAGVRFMTYDSIKALLVDGNGKLSPVNGMLGERRCRRDISINRKTNGLLLDSGIGSGCLRGCDRRHAIRDHQVSLAWSAQASIH